MKTQLMRHDLEIDILLIGLPLVAKMLSNLIELFPGEVNLMS